MANQAPLAITSISGTYGTPVALATSGGSGTGAISYAVDSGGSASGCAISGTSLSATSAGTCIVTATKAADTDYNQTSSAATTITFNMATPTVAILNIPTSATYGGSFAPTYATASNGTTSVSSSTTSVCTVSGSKVKFVGLGRCTLTAAVAATTDYTAATGVAQTFTVSQAPTTLVAANARAGLGTLTFSATLSANGAPLSGQTISFAVSGHTICTRTTNAQGVASCTVGGVAIGYGTYAAKYATTTDYLGSSATGKL